MKKNTVSVLKKFMAVIISAAMIFTSLTVTAFAEPEYVASLTTGEATTNYETVQAAIGAIPDNGSGKVTLLCDVTLTSRMETAADTNKDVTLDLAGFTVTGPADKVCFWNEVGCKLTIMDSSAEQTGTLVGGTTGSGGCVYTKGEFVLESGTLKGGISTGTASSSGGGGVYLYNTTGTMNGGVIKNCTSAKNGGGVYVQNSTFNMNGGIIDSCSTEGTGGAIYSSTTGKVNISQNIEGVDTIISNCTSTGYGGALAEYKTTNKVFTVTGGSLIGNSATAAGGAIFLNCAGEFSNVTFSGNSSKGSSTSGGVIFLSTNGDATFKNCTFSGNTSTAIGPDVAFYADSSIASFDGCTFTNSGKAAVYAKAGYITLKGENTGSMYAGHAINVDSTFDTDSKISVSIPTKEEGTEVLAGDAAVLASAYKSFTVLDLPETLELGSDGKLQTKSVVITDPCKIGETTYASLQAAIDAIPTDGAATIELLRDATLTARLTDGIDRNIDVTLDLAGFTLTGPSAAGVYANEAGSSLTIKDSSQAQTGKISGGAATSGGCVYLAGKVTLESGTIDGCASTNTGSTSGGGAFYVRSNATFEMKGGVIKNCTSAKYGGAIYGIKNANPSNIIISGGTIEGNQSTATGGAIFTGGNATITGAVIKNNTGTNGGAIYANSNSDITLKNCTFTGNTSTDATKKNTDIYVYDDSSVKLTLDGCTFTIGETPNVRNTNGEVTLKGKNTVSIYSETAPINVAADFDAQSSVTLELATYEVGKAVLAGDEAAIAAGIGAFTMINLPADTELGTDGFLHSLAPAACKIGDAKFETIQAAIDSVEIGGTAEIVLLNDVTLTSALEDGSGKNRNITLDLAGFTITAPEAARAYTNYVGSTLTIKDSSTEQTGKISGGKAATGGSVIVNGTVNFVSGTIEGAASTSETAGGGAFYVAKNGTLNMSGGLIKDCSAAYNGGAVYVVTDATNKIGGTFNMTGGTITGCSAGNFGGAVYTGKTYATLSIDGGTFIGNTSAKSSGAIMVYGPAAIKNAAFKENTAATNGGAIYVNATGDLTITGCVFEKNVCGEKYNGPDIYLYSSAEGLTLKDTTLGTYEKPAVYNDFGASVTLDGKVTGSIRVPSSIEIKDTFDETSDVDLYLEKYVAGSAPVTGSLETCKKCYAAFTLPELPENMILTENCILDYENTEAVFSTASAAVSDVIKLSVKVNVYKTIKDDKENVTLTYQAPVIKDGMPSTETVTLTPSKAEDTLYTFDFENGLPLWAVDSNLNLKVMVGTKQAGQADYALMTYFTTLHNELKDDVTDAFTANMIKFADELQKTAFGASTIVFAGWEEAYISTAVPAAADNVKAIVVDSANAAQRITSATVNVYDRNTLAFRLNAKAGDTVTITREGVTDPVYTETFDADKTGYMVTLPMRLTPAEYGAVFTVTLAAGDTVLNQITYSINSYAFAKAGTELGLALYRYGVTAAAYVAADAN